MDIEQRLLNGSREPGPAEEHVAFLARAGERLAGSLDLGTTLANLARLAVPLLADACVIDLLDDDGHLAQAEAAHVDPTKERLLRTPLTQDANGWFESLGPKLMARGEPQLTSASELSPRSARPFPAAIALGTVSVLSIPLATAGRPLGVLTLATADARRGYGGSDVAIAQDLARRASLAIDNARLYQAAERARVAAEQATARLTALQRMTAALSEATTRVKIAEVVVQHVRTLVPGCQAFVAVMSTDGQSLTTIASVGCPDQVVERYREFPLSLEGPFTECVRTREPIFIDDPTEFKARYPLLVSISDAPHDVAALPFIADDRAIGALLLRMPPATAPKTDEERSFILHIARTCAQALERALLYEAERSARAETESERRRLGLLAEASAVLNASLDPAAITDALARVAVPAFASYCIVAALEEDGSPRFLHAVHEDPHTEVILREMRERYPFGPRHPITEVARSGRPRIIPRFDDSYMRAVAEDEAHLELLHKIPTASSLVVPLNARGHTLGVLSFGLANGQFRPADLSFAEGLAHRAALALDNARLYHEAQEASRVKDEFLGVVSHELRTPLNAILGWARMLRTGAVREGAQPRALEAIERNATQQARLIDDLLDASRITAGKLRLDVSFTELAPVVDSAVQSVTPGANAKEIRIVTSFDPSSIPVLGDPNRLQQVIWNLLSNAIKFTPKGGRIDVGLARAGDEALVVVSDNGRGIRPELLPHVFERFRQGDGTLTRHSGGLGLGLSIVRHLVEAHGGTVRAESPGQDMGATFTVHVPLAKPRQLTPADQPAVAPSAPGFLLTGVRVLVVDDEPDAREILEEVLSQAGAEVKTAADAAQALDVLLDFTPDVLVSDLAMPGEDGLKLIRKLRARVPDRVASIPAIALTAYTRPEDRVQALAAGFQMHVPKPVDPTELVVTIASLRSLSPKTPPAA
jgi:signal transduction histidine kinase/ActR/RegA family two-component response regulator